MTISAGDLKLYLPVTINNTDSNGGLLSSVQIDATNTENNIFGDVLKEEQLSGSTIYRKLFCKQENALFEQLLSATAWIDKITQSIGDYIVIFSGTQTDTQNTIAPTRVYGISTLFTAATATDVIISVTVEHSSLLVGGTWPIIQIGDSIRITDKETPTSIPGNEEWLTVTNVVNTVDLNMNVTISTGLVNSYVVNSKVSSLLSLGNIRANITDWVITSTSGTYNQALLMLCNKATVEDTYTVTIKSNGISFTVSSTRLGALPDGTFDTTYTVANLDFTGFNYIEIDTLGWGGTWIENDTIIFKTHPSAKSIWEKKVTLANANAQSENSTVIAFNGQTV